MQNLIEINRDIIMEYTVQTIVIWSIILLFANAMPITMQVIDVNNKYYFSPSGPLKLVGRCALHMLHNPLLRHCIYSLIIYAML